MNLRCDRCGGRLVSTTVRVAEFVGWCDRCQDYGPPIARADILASVLERVDAEQEASTESPSAQQNNVPGTQAEGNGKEREA